MQVARWGNSLAIRLPAKLVKLLALKEGDDIDLDIAGSRTMLVSKVPADTDLLDRVRKLRGSMPADFEFDRLEANER
jgi:antitoxin MazE